MSLWDHFFGRRPPEQRRSGFDGNVLAVGMGGGGSYGGVSPRAAEALSAVTACVELISGAVASLPPSLVVDTPAGRQPAPDTAPAWRLLEQRWPNFAGSLAAQVLLHGNGLAYVRTDGRAAPLALTMVPWGWVTPKIVGTRLAFDLVQQSAETALLGLPTRMLADECVHVRPPRTDTGILGKSVLARAGGVIGEALQITEAADALWRNSMRPSAIISAPGFLDDQRRQRFLTEFMPKFVGALRSGAVPVLEGGWEYKAVALNAADAQLIESRQFSVAEICRLFSVPEPLLQLGDRVPGDLAPFTTAFAQQAVQPLVQCIEAEFDAAVLPSGMHLQLDLGGLMRGSFSSQTAAMAALVQSGIITPNDAREELGWPRHPDGDGLRVSGAPAWPADGKGMPHLASSPGPRGDAPPEPGTNEGEGSS